MTPPPDRDPELGVFVPGELLLAGGSAVREQVVLDFTAAGRG